MSDNNYPTVAADEYTFVEWCIARIKASRKAAGVVDEYRTTVELEPREDREGNKVWCVSVTVMGDVGREVASRNYRSRVEACRSFDYLLEQHPELEELEGRGE